MTFSHASQSEFDAFTYAKQGGPDEPGKEQANQDGATVNPTKLTSAMMLGPMVPWYPGTWRRVVKVSSV